MVPRVGTLRHHTRRKLLRTGLWNLRGWTALKPDRTSKYGEEASSDADGMIDQQQNPPGRRTASEGLDEARLRQRAIGVKLRQMFDEVVNEPVPDEFLDILRRADSGSKPGER
jgi:hypothetical protein